MADEIIDIWDILREILIDCGLQEVERFNMPLGHGQVGQFRSRSLYFTVRTQNKWHDIICKKHNLIQICTHSTHPSYENINLYDPNSLTK